jgi:hypothetical protein
MRLVAPLQQGVANVLTEIHPDEVGEQIAGSGRELKGALLCSVCRVAVFRPVL